MDTNVIAAVLWDTPALTASGSRAAAAFRDVMSARPIRDDQEANSDGESGDSLLMSCAKALATYFLGREEEAKGVLRLLWLNERSSNRLLPLLLLLWIGEGTDDDWHQADDLVSRIGDNQFQAHMLTKLFTFAYDSGLESAERYLERARHLAEGALKAQLETVSFNLYGTGEIRFGVYEGDDLVDLPWLDGAASKASSDLLSNLAKSEVEPPWAGSSHAGVTPANRLAAVDNQATWAGAFWRRSTYRSSLASALILTGVKTPGEAREAVSLWVLSGGANVANVVERLEPGFQVDTADSILLEDLISEARSRTGRMRFVEASLAMWDLISESTAEMLLDLLQPTESAHPMDDRIRRLWALLALRTPDAWLSRFVELPVSIRRGIASNFTPAALPGLGDALNVAVDPLIPPGPESVDFVAPALFKLGRSDELNTEWLAGVDASVLIDLIEAEEWPIPAELIDHKIQELTNRCQSDLLRARTGSYSYGGEDPRAVLGGLALYGSPSARSTAISTIIESAMAENVPRNFRLGAMQGLLALAMGGELEDEEIRTIQHAPIGTERDPLYRVEPDLLRAVKASLASFVDAKSSTPELLLLVRAPDSNARRVAVSALARTIEENQSEASIAALMGALYDPEPYVIARCLYDLPVRYILASPWRSALIDRFTSLVASGRRVRAALVRPLSEVIALEGLDHPQVNFAVQKLRSDRSWEISRIAKETL